MHVSTSTPSQLAKSSDYDITLTVAPAHARADEEAHLTLTATVTPKKSELSASDLTVVLKIVDGDAFFDDKTQSATAQTDTTGKIQGKIVCGVPETGYAQAILMLSATDKKASEEAAYTFVEGYPELSVSVWDPNPFADGKGRVSVDATVLDGGKPAPDVHLMFKLANINADFVGEPGATSFVGVTNDKGVSSVVLSATEAQSGYLRTSLVSDSKIRDTSVLSFLPSPKLELQLKNDRAPADGKSPITAIARVTDVATGAGIEGVHMLFSIWGAVTPVGVEQLGGYVTIFTDSDGYAQLAFTSTTPTAGLDTSDRLAVVMTLSGPDAPGYQKTSFYTFR